MDNSLPVEIRCLLIPLVPVVIVPLFLESPDTIQLLSSRPIVNLPFLNPSSRYLSIVMHVLLRWMRVVCMFVVLGLLVLLLVRTSHRVVLEYFVKVLLGG